MSRLASVTLHVEDAADRFMEWIEENGVYTHGIEVRVDPDVNGYGVFATKTLKV